MRASHNLELDRLEQKLIPSIFIAKRSNTSDILERPLTIVKGGKRSPVSIYPHIVLSHFRSHDFLLSGTRRGSRPLMLFFRLIRPSPPHQPISSSIPISLCGCALNPITSQQVCQSPALKTWAETEAEFESLCDCVG